MLVLVLELRGAGRWGSELWVAAGFMHSLYILSWEVTQQHLQAPQNGAHWKALLC